MHLGGRFSEDRQSANAFGKNPLQAVDWKICKFLTEYLGQKVLIVLTLWRLELIFGCQIKVLWWTLEAWTWEMSRTKSWRELHVS